jgi:hypothetical protein
MDTAVTAGSIITTGITRTTIIIIVTNDQGWGTRRGGTRRQTQKKRGIAGRGSKTIRAFRLECFWCQGQKQIAKGR